MLPANRFALKEWAVVVRALACGRQLLLLRKGGLQDEAGEFRLEHPEFFLYPTFAHQHRTFIRPEFLSELDGAVRDRAPAGSLLLSAYAVVTDCVEAPSFDALGQLTDYHVWTDDYLEMRWTYKPDLPLRALLLRAFEISPMVVPVEASFEGCKSWVEWNREIATAGARPVLSDVEFERRRERVRGVLGVLDHHAAPPSTEDSLAAAPKQPVSGPRERPPR